MHRSINVALSERRLPELPGAQKITEITWESAEQKKNELEIVNVMGFLL